MQGAPNRDNNFLDIHNLVSPKKRDLSCEVGDRAGMFSGLYSAMEEGTPKKKDTLTLHENATEESDSDVSTSKLLRNSLNLPLPKRIQSLLQEPVTYQTLPPSNFNTQLQQPQLSPT